jgi:hypothetical protein
MSQKLEASRASGPHHQLSRLAGQWEGTTKTWFDPNKLEDESPIRGSIRPLMDGRFMLYEYSSSMGNKPLTGMAIIGFHLDLQKYQLAWIDSFHTGTTIIFSEGNKGDTQMNVLGSWAYVTPEMEQYWGWRTTIEIVSGSEIIIRAFNISPEGEESRATETVLRKTGS